MLRQGSLHPTNQQSGRIQSNAKLYTLGMLGYFEAKGSRLRGALNPIYTTTE